MSAMVWSSFVGRTTGVASRDWLFEPFSTFGVGWLRGVNGVVHSSGVTSLGVPYALDSLPVHLGWCWLSHIAPESSHTVIIFTFQNPLVGPAQCAKCYSLQPAYREYLREMKHEMKQK